MAPKPSRHEERAPIDLMLGQPARAVRRRAAQEIQCGDAIPNQNLVFQVPGVENGEFKIQNFDLEGNGKRLPWLFTGQTYKQTLTEGMNKAIGTRLPEASQFIHRIESIKVESGEVIVKLRGV